MQTNRIQLPYILPSQAQKHVTHNEALAIVDVLLQASVLGIFAEPPVEAQPGDCVIVAEGAGGDWSGRDGAIASFTDGIWTLHSASDGWRVWNSATQELLVRSDGGWQPILDPSAWNPTALLGVNATADETNRFTVSSAASLFSHDGDSHRLTINRASTSDSASILFETAWSGQCELGLSDGDVFRIKLSVDGSSWSDAMTFDPSDGAISFPGRLDLTPSGDAELGGSLKLKSHTVAGLPSAATAGAGAMVFVTDESGGAVIAFSDGGAWLRTTDRASVS